MVFALIKTDANLCPDDQARHGHGAHDSPKRSLQSSVIYGAASKTRRIMYVDRSSPTLLAERSVEEARGKARLHT